MLRPEIEFSAQQTLGGRENQEDSYAFEPVDEEDLLFVVADGAGGHAEGQIASRTALVGFLDGYRSASKNPMEAGLELANIRVGGAIEKEPGSRRGMATTLLALFLRRRTLQWVSVGDSLLLLLRGGVLGRLNEDHSSGSIPEYGISRNFLFSALTGKPIPACDLHSDPFELLEGDIIIAATDGILSLPLRELSELVSNIKEKPASALVGAVLDAVAACGKSKQDNTTVAIIRVP
jgi:serine/threonine protein phosphatase PrpC